MSGTFWISLGEMERLQQQEFDFLDTLDLCEIYSRCNCLTAYDLMFHINNEYCERFYDWLGEKYNMNLYWLLQYMSEDDFAKYIKERYGENICIKEIHEYEIRFK